MKKNKLLLIVLAVIIFSLLLFAFRILAYVFLGLCFIFIGFYFNKQNDKDEKDLLKQKVDYAVGEVEAQEWLESDFAPKVSASLAHNVARITGIGFAIFVVLILIWGTVFHAIYSALLVISVSLLLLLYLIFAIWGYGKIEKRYKKLNNDWIRGYCYVVAPLVFAGMLFKTGISQNPFLSFVSLFLLISFGYAGLFIVAIIYRQFEKESKSKLEKDLRKMVKNDEKDG